MLEYSHCPSCSMDNEAMARIRPSFSDALELIQYKISASHFRIDSVSRNEKIRSSRQPGLYS
jgi:uncharacterized protein CbrC (UPF0167 family)